MSAYNATPLIPREILFGNPVRTQARISPDGKFLSFIAPVNGVLNVWVGPVDEDLSAFMPVTDDGGRGIRIHFWAPDSSNILYLQDTGGDENWRLYIVNTQSRHVRDLTPFEKVQARVVDVNRHFPDQILVAINKDNPQAHDIYKLELASGELTKVLENPGNQIGWGIDSQQLIRAATVALGDGSQQIVIRDPTSSNPEWKELITWSSDDALTSGFEGFSLDSAEVYLIDSTGVNAGRLLKKNLRSGEINILLDDPIYDVGSVIQHPDTYEIQAASVTRDKTEWTFFDPVLKADFEYLTSKIKGELSPGGRDNSDRIWLISASTDQKSTQYYLFDRSTKNIRFLFSTRPEIDEFTLSPMESVVFKSRDGLDLHAYLSLPVGVERSHLPVVLDVHGGPWARDHWGLNSEVQWLTNRGYGVLQVNYRGSTGYGKNFLNAGDKKWGGKMHDDLVDAVKWIVESGVADPDKVAIYGGSYGGYAALVGATFTPDLFKCAVDIVGISSLTTFINSIPPYWAPMISMLHRRVGNPETEQDFLKSRSPLFKVDQVKIPLLIAQGANDPRVKQAEAEQIVAALKSKNLDYEYLLFEDEGHGFARPENRLTFYAAAEAFLAKHLGGRVETA